MYKDPIVYDRTNPKNIQSPTPLQTPNTQHLLPEKLHNEGMYIRVVSKKKKFLIGFLVSWDHLKMSELRESAVRSFLVVRMRSKGLKPWNLH